MIALVFFATSCFPKPCRENGYRTRCVEIQRGIEFEGVCRNPLLCIVIAIYRRKERLVSRGLEKLHCRFCALLCSEKKGPLPSFLIFSTRAS